MGRHLLWRKAVKKAYAAIILFTLLYPCLSEPAQISDLSAAYDELSEDSGISVLPDESALSDESFLTDGSVMEEPEEILIPAGEEVIDVTEVIEAEGLVEAEEKAQEAVPGEDGRYHQSEDYAPYVPDYIPLDIDYPDHPLILKYHAEYQTNYSREWLYATLERGAPYRPYIRKRLQELGMPLCLEYLPVIESNYKIKAVSKSGATGLWQFMQNSIAGLLEKNSWLDERYDPWLSTEAALKKLKMNYDMFGDWLLALAAYNMGANGLRKIMNSSGLSTFWELADAGLLRNETKLYVPKFIAISDICTNAEYYEVDLPAYDESAAPAFEMISVHGQLSLKQLSDASGVSLDTLVSLNPALLYPVTPYNTDYKLRVPAESAELLAETISTMDRMEADLYIVEKGDSLWGISRRYGITVQDLCDANNIEENGILRIGQKLFVPIMK